MQESENPCFEKLGKSLVYARNLECGHEMKQEDLKVKVSVPKGYNALRYKDILEQILNCNVNKDDPVQLSNFG